MFRFVVFGENPLKWDCEDKIAKNQRDQVKVKKGAKGSFKYRKNPEVIEARLVELEAELEALQEQLAVLKELQQQHQQPS